MQAWAGTRRAGTRRDTSAAGGGGSGAAAGSGRGQRAAGAGSGQRGGGTGCYPALARIAAMKASTSFSVVSNDVIQRTALSLSSQL